MITSKLEPVGYVVSRVEHDADLVEFINKLAKERNIVAGVFSAIGALKRAKLGFYNQDTHEYKEIIIDHPCEIASCVGNVSLNPNSAHF